MKLLGTFLYLAVFFVLSLLTKKQQGMTLQSVRSGRNRSLVGFVVAASIAILQFVMYWSLTGLFSMTGIAALIALMLLNLVFYQIVGAVSGFTLPDRAKKIGVLSYILGAEQGAKNMALTLVLLMPIVAILATLVVFWIYPLHSPIAIVLITALQFIVGQIVMAASYIFFAWPVVTAEHIDNDFRDSWLTLTFSTLFTQTAYLIIAVALAEPSLIALCAQRHWPLPNVWWLAALPMITFIFGGILPFFVGIYRRRAEEGRVNGWYVDWLNRIAETFKLPEGPLRAHEIDGYVAELDNQIQARYANNTLFEFFEEQFHETVAAENDALDDTNSRRLLAGTSSPGNVKVPAGLRLPGPLRPQPLMPMPEDPLGALRQIIAESYQNLFAWDLRFSDLRNMLRLRQVMLQPDPVALAPFIDSQLKNAQSAAKATRQTRSVLAAMILTAISSLASWFATNYAKDIFDFIHHAVAR